MGGSSSKSDRKAELASTSVTAMGTRREEKDALETMPPSLDYSFDTGWSWLLLVVWLSVAVMVLFRVLMDVVLLLSVLGATLNQPFVRHRSADDPYYMYRSTGSERKTSTVVHGDDEENRRLESDTAAGGILVCLYSSAVTVTLSDLCVLTDVPRCLLTLAAAQVPITAWTRRKRIQMRMTRTEIPLQ
jgi:hypothetical protein